jgi:hypothetical protein
MLALAVLGGDVGLHCVTWFVCFYLCRVPSCCLLSFFLFFVSRFCLREKKKKKEEKNERKQENALLPLSFASLFDHFLIKKIKEKKIN